jgi:hypothetical protein
MDRYATDTARPLSSRKFRNARMFSPSSYRYLKFVDKKETRIDPQLAHAFSRVKMRIAARKYTHSLSQ